MPNGKDYILFYLKLLVESIDHEGHLRFSESVPYSAEMLSTITNTNVDIVRSAVKIFSQLELMQIHDDETIYMNDIETMIGSETEWAEKKRLQREKSDKNKALTYENTTLIEDNVPNKSNNCPSIRNTLSDKSIETESRVKSIDKDKDKDKDINYKNTLQNHFDEVWALYPSKRGKNDISKSITKLKVIKSKTVEEWKVIIDRYVNDKPEYQGYQNGSTFFNGGYVDYLEDNFVPTPKPQYKPNYSNIPNYNQDKWHQEANFEFVSAK